MERSSRIRSGWSSSARATASPPSSASPTTSNPCCISSPERAERVSGWSSTSRIRSATGLRLLSAGRDLPTRVNVRQDDRDDFQAWLAGEILLIGLLGASLALFVTNQHLQTAVYLPNLRLVLQTVAASAAGIIAVLTGVRYAVEGRRLDLLLCTGFLVASVSTTAFSIIPALNGHSIHRPEEWAAIVGRTYSWVFIATAPFVRGRSGPRALANTIVVALVGLFSLWFGLRSGGTSLPALDPHGETPFALTGLLQAFAH